MKSAWFANVTTRLLRGGGGARGHQHGRTHAGARSRRARACPAWARGTDASGCCSRACPARTKTPAPRSCVSAAPMCVCVCVRVHRKGRASRMRCGYASDTVPSSVSLMSWRATQFMSPKYAVGPARGATPRQRACGRCKCKRANAARRAERQVADDEAVRLAAVLVHDDDVAVAAAAAGLDHLLDDLRAAVQARAVGEHQLQLLGKRGQLRGRVARRGQHDARVLLARARVLVVRVRRQRRRAHILQRRLVAQLRLLCAQLRRDGAPLCAPRAPARVRREGVAWRSAAAAAG